MDRILKHNFNFGLHLPRNKFCDAKVRANDSTRLIPIHRVILAAVSRKFEKMFEENPGTDTTYKISEVKFETLNKIVEYIYTGQALFANDGDFWVGLVLLSINLGEVVVENIKTKVEAKPVKEEYIEMDTEGCQLKSEIEEGCDELVTSSSSLEMTKTNVDPPHFSGLPVATGPNSSISIHAENQGPPTPKQPTRTSTPGRRTVKRKIDETYIDDQGYIVTKEEYESASETDEEPDPVKEKTPKKVGKIEAHQELPGAVDDVVSDTTTTVEDMAREVVDQQVAVEEKMKEFSSTEVNAFNSKAGGSNFTFTNETEDSNFKMNNSIKSTHRRVFKLADKDLKLYPCTHNQRGCKEMFHDKTELHKHARKCKHRPTTTFSCRHVGCTKRYFYEEDYEKHVAKFHPYLSRIPAGPLNNTKMSDQNLKLEKS